MERKTRLRYIIKSIRRDIEVGDHIAGDGADIFRAACKLGHEGIVAKRSDFPYESGRSKRWIKVKNPASPAAKRVIEENF